MLLPIVVSPQLAMIFLEKTSENLDHCLIYSSISTTHFSTLIDFSQEPDPSHLSNIERLYLLYLCFIIDFFKDLDHHRFP